MKAKLSNQNYLQVVNMTDDEKREMYGSCEKSELIEMIISRERADEAYLYGVSGGTTYPSGNTVSTTIKGFISQIDMEDGDPEIMNYVNEHIDELFDEEEPKRKPLDIGEIERFFKKPSIVSVVCPVCCGTGRVISGFYGDTRHVSTNGEKCRSCDGKGYLIINQ